MPKESYVRNILSDALIGASAGALAVWVMDRVDWFNFEHEDPTACSRTQSVRPGGMDPAHIVANLYPIPISATRIGIPKSANSES
jgi:hypothetical protein